MSGKQIHTLTPPIQIYIETKSGVGVAFSSHFTVASEDL